MLIRVWNIYFIYLLLFYAKDDNYFDTRNLSAIRKFLLKIRFNFTKTEFRICIVRKRTGVIIPILKVTNCLQQRDLFIIFYTPVTVKIFEGLCINLFSYNILKILSLISFILFLSLLFTIKKNSWTNWILFLLLNYYSGILYYSLMARDRVKFLS